MFNMQRFVSPLLWNIYYLNASAGGSFPFECKYCQSGNPYWSKADRRKGFVFFFSWKLTFSFVCSGYQSSQPDDSIFRQRCTHNNKWANEWRKMQPYWTQIDPYRIDKSSSNNEGFRYYFKLLIWMLRFSSLKYLYSWKSELMCPTADCLSLSPTLLIIIILIILATFSFLNIPVSQGG